MILHLLTPKLNNQETSHGQKESSDRGWELFKWRGRNWSITKWWKYLLVIIGAIIVTLPIGIITRAYGKASANDWKPIALEIGETDLVITIVKGRFHIFRTKK